MTAAAIQALIDAARTGAGDLVTWAELKAILEGLKDQDAVYTFNSRQGTVLPLEGDYSLNLLSDVVVSTPTTNQVLQYNGTNWVNATSPATTVSSVFGRTGTITAAEGDYSLTQLSDVTISSPVLNQLLVYNGSIWTNTTLSALTTTIYSGDGQLASNRIIDLSTYTLNFSSSTNSRLFIDTNGRIGVNTISPSALFSIGTGSGQVGFIGGLSSPNRARLFYDTDNSGWKFGIGKLISGVFTEQMTFQDNGNVGINYNAPRLKTEIAATLSVPNVLTVNPSNGNLLLSDGGNIGMILGLYDSSANYASYIQARNNNSTLNPNTPYNIALNPLGGNVGIGTASPSARLQVSGTSATTTVTNISQFSGIRIDGNQSNTSRIGLSYQDGGGGAAMLLGRDNSYGTNISFYTNPASTAVAGAMTERMVIDVDGNVGIGTPTPNAKLEVSGVARFTGTNGFSIGNDAVQNRIQYSTDWTRFSLLTSADVYAGFSAGRVSIGATYANSASPTNGMIIEGDVGIGTNVASDKLHVVGNIRASGDVLSFSNIIVRKDGVKGLVLRNQDITNRWYVFSDNSTETGSNVGSDFNIARYSDAGSLLSHPFFIKRSTGFVGINQQLPAYNLDVNGSANFTSFLSGKSDISHSVVSITNGDYSFKALKTYTPTSTQNNLNSYGAVIQTTWNLTSGTYTGTASYNAAGILSQVTIAGNATTRATQPFRGVLSGIVGLPAGAAMNISKFSYFEARKPDDAAVTGHVVETIYGLYIESLKGTASYTITNGWGIYQEGFSDNNYFSGKVLIGTSSVGSSPLRINGLPTSATGLSTGDLWNDSGTLKIA